VSAEVEREGELKLDRRKRGARRGLVIAFRKAPVGPKKREGEGGNVLPNQWSTEKRAFSKNSDRENSRGEIHSPCTEKSPDWVSEAMSDLLGEHSHLIEGGHFCNGGPQKEITSAGGKGKRENSLGGESAPPFRLRESSGGKGSFLSGGKRLSA